MLFLDTAVNYLAILASTAAMMTVGFLWYSPLLFGKPWKKLTDAHGIKGANAKKPNGKSYLLMTLGVLISSFVLAHFINFAAAYTAFDGAATGFWLGLGTAVPALMNDVLFAGKPWKLYFINIGHILIGMMIAGAILAVWV